MLAVVVRGRHEVGVLDHAGKRHVRIGDVEPIDVAQLAVELEQRDRRGLVGQAGKICL